MSHFRDGCSRFKRRIRVTLSKEGKEKLFSRSPLDGWVRGLRDGLVIVLEPDAIRTAIEGDAQWQVEKLRSIARDIQEKFGLEEGAALPRQIPTRRRAR